MFYIDTLVITVLMILLFVRQIFTVKDPAKINYAPLVITLGLIGGVLHLLLYLDATQAPLSVFKEALLSPFIALTLYMFMNILHQTQQTSLFKIQEEFSIVLVKQVSELKNFVQDLEQRMTLFAQEDRKQQQDMLLQFQHEMHSLRDIKQNQEKIFTKFDEAQERNIYIAKELKNFVEIQMPQIDSVVHKHIDILRVAQQDHYNQLHLGINELLASKQDVTSEVEELRGAVASMQNLADSIAKSITRHTLQQLSDVTKAFEGEIITLKTQAEGVKTSLLEGESRLEAIRKQSEMIMKQMVLSSNKMEELKVQNEGLYNLYDVVKVLVSQIEEVYEQYTKSQTRLSVIAHEIELSENENIQKMRQEIEQLSQTLNQKIDDSLSKLHEHYHIVDKEVTQNIQFLAQRAKVQNYTNED